MSDEPLIAQMLAEIDARSKEMGLYKDPSEFAREKKAKGSCSICGRPVYGNVEPEKILTCGRCVIILHELAQRDPHSIQEYHDRLIDQGKTEAARSVEFFIIPEQGGDTDEPKRRKTNNLGSTLGRKRFSREVRRPHGEKPFHNNRVLGQGRSKVR